MIAVRAIPSSGRASGASPFPPTGKGATAPLRPPLPPGEGRPRSGPGEGLRRDRVRTARP